MSVRLLYGNNVRGELVCVTAVPSGLACGLRCPNCGSLLIARKGGIRVHHLAHYKPDTQCVGAVETVTHLLAKEALRERKRLTLPGLDIVVQVPPELRQLNPGLPPRECVFETVSIEYSVGEMRLDALVSGDEGTFAVEIKVTHEVTPEKIGRLRSAGLIALEIDLSAYCRWDTPRETIAEAVTHKAPRRWLTLPTIYANAIIEAWAQGPKLIEQPRLLDPQPLPDLRIDKETRRQQNAERWGKIVAEFENHPWRQPPAQSRRGSS